MLNKNNALAYSLMAFSLLGLSACSTPEPREQHIPMCQALAENLLGTPQGIVWTGSEKAGKGYDDLIVTINFTAPTGANQIPMTASCHYEYVADDEETTIIDDPMDAYAGAPYRMTLNDKLVLDRDLINATNNVMLRMGKEMLESAKQGVQQGAEVIQEKGAEAIQSIQEGAGQLQQRIEAGIDAGVNYQPSETAQPPAEQQNSYMPSQGQQ